MRNVYTTGFVPEDFTWVKPGFALVQAIRPESLSTIISVQSQVQGNQVYCFKVLKGSQDLEGKTVILRNSLLESVDVKLDLFLIDEAHITAIVNVE